MEEKAEMNLDMDISQDLSEEELNYTPPMDIEVQREWFNSYEQAGRGTREELRVKFKAKYGYDAYI